MIERAAFKSLIKVRKRRSICLLGARPSFFIEESLPVTYGIEVAYEGERGLFGNILISLGAPRITETVCQSLNFL